MSNKKYYWLKLKKDFFQNKEVQYMRQAAGGAVYTIIYLKMMLLSINTGGEIVCDGLFGGDIAKEIGMVIGERDDDVAWTMTALESCHLLNKVDEKTIVLPGVTDLIGSETNKAASMRRLREQRKLESQEVTQLPDVTFCYTEKEIDKEKDIDLDLEEEVIELYRTTCVSLPPLKRITESRKNAVKLALQNFTMDELKTGFQKAEQSDFLKGKNRTGWKATFDWLMNSINFDKVLDGNYDNAKPIGSSYCKEEFGFVDFTSLM